MLSALVVVEGEWERLRRVGEEGIIWMMLSKGTITMELVACLK